MDEESGGLLTCLADDGSIISEDKYLWSQCRAIWTFAALYNHIENAPGHLELAENIAAFVLKHGRNPAGRYYYRVSRHGEPLEGPISVYTDFFAAYGMAELFRATGKAVYLEEAVRALDEAAARATKPGCDELAPYRLPEGAELVHGLPMILLESIQEVARSVPNSEKLQNLCEDAVETIMTRHVRPEQKLLLENLGKDGRVLDTPAGHAVNPGHALESMWFVIHHALRTGNKTLAGQACEVMRWHLERGWDAEFGGLFLGIDAQGNPPWIPHAEKKIWWAHTEALYALHLPKEVSGEDWCAQWLEKIAAYSFAHFPNSCEGEWFQRLDREGNPVTAIVALRVKDPSTCREPSFGPFSYWKVESNAYCIRIQPTGVPSYELPARWRRRPRRHPAERCASWRESPGDSGQVDRQ